ncbi:MAG: GNAT family N-acetyltransferase [Clostridiales bacterium]|nr:GNAT family N-acetyltransferase [Clostridiales bacterium]
MQDKRTIAGRFGLSEKEYDQIWEIMLEAFPPAERRSRAGLDRIMANPAFSLITFRDPTGKPAAFLTSWRLAGFCYLEHFAVSAGLRGQGVGGRMLRDFLETAVGPVILEAEPPENEIARRRIGFYRRFGFHLNGYPYIQPPLQPDTPAVPLCIMSRPAPLKPAEFESVRQTLYRKVYDRRTLL